MQRMSTANAPSSAPDRSTSPFALQRLASIDAYRGLVMLLMMAEVLHLAQVWRAIAARTAADVPPSDTPWSFLPPAMGMAAIFAEYRVWKLLAWHQTHVEWAGCSLHDLIQPSFSFLVGVALPFSLASRLAKGQTKARMFLHAAWRAALLCALGIFLRSIGKSQTNFTFEDTLTQIGLGYLPLFLLGLTRPRWHYAALVVVLVGYYGAFAAWPVPASQDFYQVETVGVPPNWTHHYPLHSFEAHWNKNSNLAWAFDRWFLNLFPRESPFLFNRGGYATLSFIPTLGTMILGLICGAWLRRAVQHAGVATGSAAAVELPYGEPIAPRRAITWMLVAAGICFAVSLGLDALHLGPIVKRIWTPTWTLFSGGWCFLFMAAFYALIDVRQRKTWAWPLVVIGANSIAAYMIAHLIEHFTIQSLYTHLGEAPFQVFGPEYQPFLVGLVVLLIYWLILWWMYRRRIFLKV